MVIFRDKPFLLDLLTECFHLFSEIATKLASTASPGLHTQCTTCTAPAPAPSQSSYMSTTLPSLLWREEAQALHLLILGGAICKAELMAPIFSLDLDLCIEPHVVRFPASITADIQHAKVVQRRLLGTKAL